MKDQELGRCGLRQIVRALVLTTALNGTVSARQPADEPSPQLINRVNATLATKTSSLQSLRLVSDSDGMVTARIAIDGHERTLILHPHSMRSDGFRVLVQNDATGKLVAVKPPPIHTYRGTIVELPGAIVSASIVDGAMTATIRNGSTVFGVQPVSKLNVSGAADEHVVYRSSDWTNSDGFRCGTPPQSRPSRRDGHAGATGAVDIIGLLSADIAVDTDVEFFKLNGESVEETVIDVETILEMVEFIYERDVSIVYEVTTIVVRTVEPDPYDSTNANDLFCEFRARWNTGPESAITRDVAHLFTGKELDGSTIGISRFAVMCNIPLIDPFGCAGGNSNLAYGVSQSHFSPTLTARAALTAHELGHAWSTFHCDGQSDCHIMCSVLGSCAGIEGSDLKFGSASAGTIANFRDTRTCLDEETSPHELPFSEDFSSGLLPESNWTYNHGTTVTNSALAEPSGPFALNLDAENAEEFGDDEVRTTFIALDDATNALLSYHTQHRGVEAGETLFVEYWTASLLWKQLNRIDSDGVDQSTFVSYEHVLPNDAMHAEFRLRFRTDVSDNGDDWYIDNVQIIEMCSSDLDCENDAFCDGEEPCVGGLCATGSAMCAGADGCDENVNTCYSASCGSVPLVEATNRYLFITPPEGSDPVALIVAPVCNPDAAKYVGFPSANDIATLVYDPESVARLTPEEWGDLVRVRGNEIVPGTDYLVWTECSESEQRFVSVPATATTPDWGDVVGELVDGMWTPPDSMVNIPTDVLSIVAAFQGEPSAPARDRVDLVGVGPHGPGCVPDLSIDILDILQGVIAFQGIPYTEGTACPDPCQPG